MPHILCHQENAHENNNEISLHTYENGHNPEHRQHQMLARMWSHRSSRSLLGGVQDGAATLEDGLVISYKTKPTLTMQSSNHAPQYLTRKLKNLCPQKNLHRDVYSSFFIIAQTWKQPKHSSVVNREMNCGSIRQWNITQHERELPKCEKTRRKLNRTLLSKRSKSEVFPLWLWKQIQPVSLRTRVWSLAQWIKDPVLLWTSAQFADVAWIWHCLGCDVGQRLQLRCEEEGEEEGGGEAKLRSLHTV